MKKIEKTKKQSNCEFTENFLKNIEKNTTIEFDWSKFSFFDKLVNSENVPISDTTIDIMGIKIWLNIYSCRNKKCNKILGINIYYGFNGSEEKDALKILEQMKSYDPNLEIKLRDVYEN
jgi:hypothetical protein